jgi:hypothetical protein
VASAMAFDYCLLTDDTLSLHVGRWTLRQSDSESGPQ